MVVGWRRRKDKGKTRRGTRVPCRMAILLLTARAVELWSTFFFPFHFFEVFSARMLSTLFEVQSFCVPLVLYFLFAPTFSLLVALGHPHASAVY